MSDAVRMFVEGRGTFVDDLAPPGTVHLKVVRSPYARARLLRVRGGITHAELPANLSSVGEGATGGRGLVPHPVLAADVVNYVGQPVAAVLGRSAAQAEDLLPSVEVEYERLKPVADPEAALSADPIHEGTKSNVFAQARLGADFARPKASVVIEETLANDRVVPNPIEPRGIVAEFDGSTLTVWASTQSVYSWREGLCNALKLPLKSVRVLAMDAGGAFGSKGGLYPEYVIAAHAAMKLRRPVKWIETRSEHLMATFQGRGARAHLTMYGDRSGKVLGLKADLLVDGGAYPLGMGRFSPGWIGFQLTGPYAIRNAFVSGRSVYTNKVPLGPYRGAGRPEAAFFVERMMDLLADELSMDPIDLRLRNTSERPFVSPLGIDVPPSRPFLEAAVRAVGYRRRARDRKVGFSFFVLVPETESGEGARIRVTGGRVHVWLGGSGTGQGHEDFVKTLLEEELGVSPSSVDLERGDTAMVKKGVGSWGSRSAVTAGAALLDAATKLKAKATRTEGRYSARSLLAGEFDVDTFVAREGSLNSFGANLITADVDEAGTVRVVDCIAYYDVGRPLNPTMVEGQIVGGSAQAIGQVLYEGALYDDEGQILAASLAEAGVPPAADMPPRFVVKLAKSRSGFPHGAKGLGESPTIGVPPALVRAIERQAGRRITATPVRPESLSRPFDDPA